MAENGILDYQGMNQAIYRGATSNIIVDTQSMSIEIGAGNTSHTSNLHFECNHDANVASIKLNSNVTTEFSRSKKLIKYPRVALTADNQPTGYVASASNFNASYPAWEAFDGSPGVSDTTTRWQPENTQASAGVLRYTDPGSGPWVPTTSFTDNITTIANGSTIRGDWLQLESPDKVNVKSYRIYNSTNYVTAYNAHTVVLLGSNTGINDWVYVGSGERELSWSNTTATTSGNDVSTVAIENTPGNMGFYRYHRLIVTKVTNQHIPVIFQLELFGVPEYDPDAYGTDVTLKSLANVPNTDWLEVYYDAKGLGNGSTTVNDLKPVGTANNGTVGGNTSVTDEAFTFDGTGDYITSTVTTGTGNQSFSVACWFKFTTLGGLLWGFTGTTNGTSGTNPTNNSTPHAYFNTTGSINFDFWANSTVTAEKLIEANRWYSGVWTYDGTMRKIYINGTQVHLPQSSTPLSIIDNTSRLSIGIYPNNLSGGPMTGSVANFRLFNRALTTDEIYQLYAYQKEDFGHGDLSMTLKAGRLGIGTSDPGAVLDVRGDIYRNGIPAFPIPTAHFYKQSSSTTSTSHYANIRDGWVALTHAPVTVPGVIEKYSLAGADYTTDSGNSGLVVKLCKEGLYKIEFNCSLSTQSGINSHIGVYIRPVYTSYISENTGTSYIGIGQSNGYNVIQGTGSNNAHLFNHHEIIRVTKAPGYAFVTMTPNSNDSTHFRFENYGSTPYAVMNVMYLG